MTTFIAASKDKIPAYRYKRYSDLVLAKEQRALRKQQRCERVKAAATVAVFILCLSGLILMFSGRF